MTVNDMNNKESLENTDNSLVGNKTEEVVWDNKEEVVLLLNDNDMNMVSFAEVQALIGEGNSLLKKHLTEEVFNEYKDVKTSSGTTLYDVIRSCLKHPKSKVGFYAWDAESYKTFEKLFVPTIHDFHGVDSTSVYDGQLGEIKLDLRLDPASYKDIRIRMWANLDGRFTATQNKEDAEKIEKQVTDVLLKNFGGQYFSAATTPSEQWAEWQEKGRGFPLEDAFLVDAGIIKEFWPTGSGMWMDNPENPTVIIIVNEEDHIRFTGFHRDMQVVYDKVSAIYNKLEQELPFAKHEKYGNLGSCPSNIGHMFKSGIRVKFPKLLASNPNAVEELRAIAKEYGCEIRGQGGEHSKSFDTMEVSNSRRFMSPQEAVMKWSELLNRLAEMEAAIA